MTLVYRKGAMNEANPLVGDQTSHLTPQFHGFGMARFRQMKIYDGSPRRGWKTRS
jgi:gamma-glutamylcysteine synthetase